MTPREKYLEAQVSYLLNIVKCLKEDVCKTSPECVAPEITFISTDQEVEVGTDLVLSVIATGSSLTYQWRKDGINIDGETEDTLSIDNIQLDDIANYSVVITNTCGILTSDSINVTVSEDLLTYYYGWRSSQTLANSDVEVEGLQFSLPFISGEDLIADFTSNTNPQILILAEPKTEPLKTHWLGTQYNQGNIGDPDNDLFNYLETTSYRVYYTIYPTQQTQTEITFQVSSV